MSGQWHPNAEALARHQAGRTGGFRGRRLAAHVASCADCASVTDQLAGVSTVLAAVPAPPMPDAVERQIMAALATEAATRQASPAAGSAAGPATAVPRQAAGPAASGSGTSKRSRSHGFRPAMAFASAAACLLLVGFGYLITRTQSSSSSSGTSAAVPATGSASGPAMAGRAPGPQGKAISPTTGVKPQEGESRTPFLVVHSGTDYQRATLAAQVRVEVAQNGTSGGSSTPSAAAGTSGAVPSSAAASGTGDRPPSPALVGCVSQLTGNVPPSLVDRATYEGKPVYVIAVADRAWVVGLGCTASNSELIAKVTLHTPGISAP